MPTFILLLRGVNVGGKNRVPMADLKKLCEGLGYRNVVTYLNSGNAVLEGPGSAPALAKKVEAALAKELGVTVPVVVRAAKDWAVYVDGNPFPDAEAKLLHLCLANVAVPKAALAGLAARGVAGERVAVVGDALWIDYADSGVARSKLTPSVLDKAAGAPVTARNWNTVQALAKLVA